jgi:hypothetical protein
VSAGARRRPRSPRALPLLVFALLLGPAALHAVDFELTPSVGGIAGGAVSTRQGDLTLDPGFTLGLSLGWRVRHDGLLEIAYARQETRIELESRPLFDATLEYLHGGGVWEIRDYGATRPFIGLAFGASRIEPDAAGIDDEWLFSAGLYGGVKHWFGDRIGLRVEGRGLLHAAGSGGGFFCSSVGGGAGCAVNLEGTGFLQIQGLVGLIARM